MRRRTLDEQASGLIGKPAMREVVPSRPVSSVRWTVHGYPDPVARWNFHPEYEIHLIQRTTGRYIIGNVVGTFEPGQLVLVGPNVPHDWITDVGPGEVIPERDVVLHFHGEWLARCADLVPELRTLDDLLARSTRGIEFLGHSAEEGARLLLQIGQTQGIARVLSIFGLLGTLAEAPDDEYRPVMSEWMPTTTTRDALELTNRAIDYIFANISGDVRLSDAAQLAGMSSSAFSRYFKSASGKPFSRMVSDLRLAEARRLLEMTDQPIAGIAQAVGFTNLSNFNRQFKSMHAMTPRDYRKLHR